MHESEGNTFGNLVVRVANDSRIVCPGFGQGRAIPLGHKFLTKRNRWQISRSQC